MSDAELAHAILNGIADFLQELTGDDAPGIEEIQRRASEHLRLLKAAMTPTYATSQDDVMSYMEQVRRDRAR